MRHPQEHRQPRDPGATLFQGLRIRLTLWYCGVLGVALILFGVALYTGTHYFLLNPIEQGTAQDAHQRAQQWLNGSSDMACIPFGPHVPGNDGGGPPANQKGLDKAPPGLFISEATICFDQNGQLLHSGYATSFTPPGALLTTSIVKSALQTGQPTTGVIDLGNGGGQIYSYALPVPNGNGHGYQGVVLVGESIQTQENTLSLLLMLLLTIGCIALAGAGIGGLFLANRALVPARLAWSNQQRFIADASHELRTPLTLLRADAEVLLRGRTRLDAEDAALLEDIVAETKHMTTLANNMLVLARLDAEIAHREHEVINLTKLAQASIHRVQAYAEQQHISLHSELEDDLCVIGDPLLLQQAQLILLDNAIKYNRPDGHVMIRTTHSNGRVSLEVRDTGIGIDDQHLPHLGTRFYRVDKARARATGGTGLGLAIAQGIATSHGGSLTLSSMEGQGTRAVLQLPLAQHHSIRSAEQKSGELA